MRWFASLVVLCLLAGTGVRPRTVVRARPDAPAQLSSAEGLVPLVSSRRSGVVSPEQRLTPFVLTVASPSPVPPAGVALPAPRAHIAGHVPASLRPHSARGPPSDGFVVVESIAS